MFMGHFGPAVWDTQRGKGEVLVPLWAGFLAVQFIDIIFALLAIAGLEGETRIVDGMPLSVIPYSHSLLSSLFLAAIGGGLFKLFRPKSGAKGFWVVFGLVFSHWVLDLIVHRPDLPLWPGSSVELGFGIWNYPIPAFLFEIGLLLAAFIYWLRVTRGPRLSVIALSVLFLFMVGLQIYVITAPGIKVQNGTFDPAAGPQGALLGLSALLIFGVLTAAIAWIETKRIPKA